MPFLPRVSLSIPSHLSLSPLSLPHATSQPLPTPNYRISGSSVRVSVIVRELPPAVERCVTVTFPRAAGLLLCVANFAIPENQAHPPSSSSLSQAPAHFSHQPLNNFLLPSALTRVLFYSLSLFSSLFRHILRAASLPISAPVGSHSQIVTPSSSISQRPGSVLTDV